MAYLPAFHTGFGPWVYPDAKPAARDIIVELGLRHDEICWLTAQPGTSYATLWEAQAAREKLADAEPETRYEIKQRLGAGDFTWVPGHEPAEDLGLID
jgi:hypothetical protein